MKAGGWKIIQSMEAMAMQQASWFEAGTAVRCADALYSLGQPQIVIWSTPKGALVDRVSENSGS